MTIADQPENAKEAVAEKVSKMETVAEKAMVVHKGNITAMVADKDTSHKMAVRTGETHPPTVQKNN